MQIVGTKVEARVTVRVLGEKSVIAVYRYRGLYTHKSRYAVLVQGEDLEVQNLHSSVTPKKVYTPEGGWVDES